MEEQKAETTEGAGRGLLASVFNGKMQEVTEAWDNTEIAEDWGTLPAGKYLADIVGGELSTSGRKGTAGYKLTFKITEGDHAGRQFWHDVWLTPAAMPMAKRDLRKIGVERLEQLEKSLDRVFECRVTLVLREGDDGTQYNRVRRFDVIGTREIEKDPYHPPEGYEVTYDADSVII